MEDKSTEIARDDLPLLKNLYTPDGTSKTYLSFKIIDNYMSWFNQDPNLDDIKFFCLNGDFSNGTFFVIDDNIVYADTIGESGDELLRLLLSFDFPKGVGFLNVNKQVEPAVRETIKQKKLRIYTDECFMLHYLPKEKALELDVCPPEGIELKPLTKSSDIQRTFDVWSASDQTSVRFFERAAKFDANVGAFLSDGTLVAWVYRFPNGLILALQTDKNHYGRGYGSLVAKALCKKIASLGEDVYAGILEENVASRSLFGKLGFKHIDDTQSIGIEMNG